VGRKSFKRKEIIDILKKSNVEMKFIENNDEFYVKVHDGNYLFIPINEKSKISQHLTHERELKSGKTVEREYKYKMSNKEVLKELGLIDWDA